VSTEANVGNAAIGSSSVVSAVGVTGLMAQINEYAILISWGLSLFGIMVGIFFHVLNIIHRNRREKKEDERFRQELKKELMKEIKDEHD